MVRLYFPSSASDGLICWARWHIPDVFQNDLICELRYDRVVTESCKLFKAGLSVFLPGLYLIVEYLVWLPAKDITYRFCCCLLKLLMFEF